MFFRKYHRRQGKVVGHSGISPLFLHKEGIECPCLSFLAFKVFHFSGSFFSPIPAVPGLSLCHHFRAQRCKDGFEHR